MLMGGADQYVPNPEAYAALAPRMAAAIGPNASVVVVAGGDHDPTGLESQFVANVTTFLAML